MHLVFYSSGTDTESWLVELNKQLPTAKIHVFSEEPAGWQADYALVWQPPGQLFQRHQNLKGIINLGAGVNALLSLPELPKDVPVFKLRDAGMADWMLDYIRYGVLHFERNFDYYQQQQQSKHWLAHSIEPRNQWPVGILGLGAIGSQVAKGLVADGYPVLGWSRSEKQLEGITTFYGEAQLHQFLTGCRIIVNLLPATKATYNLLNAERLKQLPQGAVLINVGRGESLDLRALTDALSDGHLRGAILDVFTSEPLTMSEEIWQQPGVMITPHVAAPTPITEAAAQIHDYLRALENNDSLPQVDRNLGY